MANGSTALEFEKPIVELELKIEELRVFSKEKNVDVSGEIKALEEKCEILKHEIYNALTPWHRVQLARHPQRPYTLDYINLMMTNFVELHGDRLYGDDPSIVGGFAMLDDIPVMVLGHQKGRNIDENMKRNFGSAHPEGYRKAIRLMMLAAKFGKPVVCLLDTQGAYPGDAAEARGIAEAIARNMKIMSTLPVPIVVVVIGEGGSGGALGIGVGNRVLMMENAIYSVISPEGCASILYKDSKFANEAAKALKVTAQDLKELGVIDEIVPEPLGGAHRNMEVTAENLKSVLKRNLIELIKINSSKLIEMRYKKFRAMGSFEEKKKKCESNGIKSKKRKG
ncbi:MAG: acetyl-CoA carboxylase carboxyltransferase subunit alpha [Elusimicrobiota bacterium]